MNFVKVTWAVTGGAGFLNLDRVIWMTRDVEGNLTQIGVADASDGAEIVIRERPDEILTQAREYLDSPSEWKHGRKVSE